ncbi:hypothetical protein AB0O50_08835 [Streptomyces cyaneofuscatus]|uniref:hypothetical protein n=1 Tax=Streptomyces cyaneofuscatus TaxID=66883 RepID=UPI003416DECF
MNNTQRVLTALAVAGAVLSSAGSAYADEHPLINRDESANLYAETLGDSINSGIGNQLNPMSVVGGIAGSNLG